MDYSRIYNQLISKRQNIPPPENVYCEKHHIIPKCLKGTNDKSNIVRLTAREHYIAHLLLAKIHKNKGLDKAVALMSRQISTIKFKFSSRLYQKSREEFANKKQQFMKGKKPIWLKRNPRSENSKQKIANDTKGIYHISYSDWLKLKSYGESVYKEIQKKLPSDFKLTDNEIQSAFYQSILNLVKIYREGPMPFVVYCYRYAKIYTLSRLLKDYKKLKKFEFSAGLSYLNDTEYEFELDISTNKDYEETFYTKLLCDDLLEKMDETDRRIAQMIIQGFSYQEIGKELGTNKMDISRRMKKYSGLK